MPAPLLLGAMLGAAATFLLDPDQGRRRRAMLREQVSSRAHRLNDSFGVARRDLGNRARGVVFGLRSRFNSDEVRDEILVEIGRAHVCTPVTVKSRMPSSA